jgi:predicted nucleic acid-binding Zn ribbon protein
LRTSVHVTPHCTICGKEIPADHPKPKTTLTCSDECRDTREAWRRAKEDEKRCRYCMKPATPAERSRYRRWRNAERKNPPPDAELSPEEITEREYRIANPPKKRGPKPLGREEEPKENDNAG